MLKTTKGLEDQITDLIAGSTREMTVGDISYAILGVDDLISCQKIRRHLKKLVESGNVSKAMVPGKNFHVYSKSGRSLETDICEICQAIKNVSDLRDGMCEMCYELINQTSPSIPRHETIIAPRIRKIDNAFPKPVENANMKFPDADSIYNMFIGLYVKIVVDVVGEPVYGKVVKVNPKYIALHGEHGPILVDKNAIVTIGEWSKDYV